MSARGEPIPSGTCGVSAGGRVRSYPLGDRARPGRGELRMSDARPLYIGIDREKIVVAPTPLTVRPGRSRRRRRGSVTEVVPVPASGRSWADRARFAGQLTLVLLFLSGLLNAGGVAWWPVLGASALIVTAFAAGQARAARTGLIVVPPGDRRHVMSTSEERAAYGKAL